MVRMGIEISTLLRNASKVALEYKHGLLESLLSKPWLHPIQIVYTSTGFLNSLGLFISLLQYN